jgi:hypothetical protein
MIVNKRPTVCPLKSKEKIKITVKYEKYIYYYRFLFRSCPCWDCPACAPSYSEIVVAVKKTLGAPSCSFQP